MDSKQSGARGCLECCYQKIALKGWSKIFHILGHCVLFAGLVFSMLIIITSLTSAPVYAEQLNVNEITNTEAPSGTYSITINETGDGHLYSAYQIFAGDVTEETVTENGKQVTKTVLSNITAGSGLKQDTDASKPTLVAALKADTVLKSKNGIKDLTDSSSAADIAAAIEAAGLSADESNALAQILNHYKADSATGTSVRKADNTDYVISGLPAGYYLVVDGQSAEASAGTPSSYSSLILQVVGNVEVEPKTSAPQVIKKVYDADYQNNSSAFLNEQEISLGEGYNDVTDASVGDPVEFEIFATLPDNYDEYEHYYYAIEDTMDESLEPIYSGESNIEMNLPSNVGPNGEVSESGIYNVFAEEEDGTSYYSVEYKNPEDSEWQLLPDDDIAQNPAIQVGKVYLYWFNPSEDPSKNRILLVFPDLKNVNGITKNAVIKFSFTATLNGKALTGNNQGNINRVKLYYSNNPENPGNGNYPPQDMGHTPDDMNVVFTYGIDVSKISSQKDSAGNDINLKGATFALSAFYDINTGMLVDDTYSNSENVEKVYMLFSANRNEAIKDDGGAVYPQYLDIFKNAPTADEKPEEVGPWYSKGNEGYGTRIFSVGDDGKIQVKGLNAGTYYLEEIKAPDGYDKLVDPIKIVISPTVVNTQNYINTTVESVADPLKTKNADILTRLNGNVFPKRDTTGKYVEDGNIAELDSTKTNASSGYVAIKVKNIPLAPLPETGGSGVAAFYVIGACLIAGAVVLLVVKKRVRA